MLSMKVSPSEPISQKIAEVESSAPEPFDLFLASIGTCTGIYILLFCQARHIPTERLKSILRTERNRETRMIDRIVIEIQLPPEFPQKYRERLPEVAGKCSVKKHLENPPLFEIYTRDLSVMQS